jgi:hypothetical protein
MKKKEKKAQQLEDRSSYIHFLLPSKIPKHKTLNPGNPKALNPIKPNRNT